jgi:hypothetical protein
VSQSHRHCYGSAILIGYEDKVSLPEANVTTVNMLVQDVIRKDLGDLAFKFIAFEESALHLFSFSNAES